VHKEPGLISGNQECEQGPILHKEIEIGLGEKDLAVKAEYIYASASASGSKDESFRTAPSRCP
jgi:hypothetical protein